MKDLDLNDLCNNLNNFLNTTLFDDYCPNGLQIEGKKTLNKIATAVSASCETIEKAVEGNYDALIVHHGIFWKGDPYPIIGVNKKKIETLIKNDISLLAYHLPLDAHHSVGNNWKVARDLNWQNLTPCAYYAGVPIGVMARFPPINRDLFIKNLETYYEHPANVALGGKEIVESVYLLSGGAYKNLIDAAKCGADCMITGNFDEPAWSNAKEYQINFIALGHSATERVGPKALAEYIKDFFQIECNFIDTYNPF